MTSQEQIQISKNYISRHKNDDVDFWQPLDKFGNEKYLAIYSNLINGTYGEARCLDEEFDDDGEIISHGYEYEVEIGRFDSADGNPVLFAWTDNEYS